MANPITEIKRMEFPEAVVKEQNMTEITEAVSENKEAILKGIELLATINESGSLDAINALVKHRKDAMENIVGEINKPQYTSTIENLSKLVFFIGDLDVSDLEFFTGKINEGMKEAKTASKDEQGNTSYMGLLKALKDPDINKSITFLLSFLRGMGKEL